MILKGLKFSVNITIKGIYNICDKYGRSEYVRELRDRFSDKRWVVIRNFGGNDHRLRPFTVEV